MVPLQNGDPTVTDIVALEDEGHLHTSWPSDCAVRLLTSLEAAGLTLAEPNQHWVWPVWSIFKNTDSQAHLLVASFERNVLTIFDPFIESVGQWMDDYPILHAFWECMGRPKPYYWVCGEQRSGQRDCMRRSLNYLKELCGPDKVCITSEPRQMVHLIQFILALLLGSPE
jgi:hypothetical protein